MKQRLLIVTAILFLCEYGVFSQAGEWTWVKGPNTSDGTGNFGTQGVESPSNEPPSLYEACEWTDTAGNFWLFGGEDGTGEFWGDLWRYNPVTNNWTWMNGTGTPSETGNYGTQGVAGTNVVPPSLGFGMPSWVDKNGNLWFLGGVYYEYEFLFPVEYVVGDMWMYNISTNEWTWENGTGLQNPVAVYGTMGIESLSNSPGSRQECSATWVDSAGYLWLYGGADDLGDSYADLWRYNVNTNAWTWMGGSQNQNFGPTYGAEGVAAAGNTPGSRWAYGTWVDATGNFWLYGGEENNPNSGTDYIYNDMWMYNPTTGYWTWMAGTDNRGSAGDYGTKCTSATGLESSAHFENRARWKDDCGNFWFYGGASNSAFDDLYDDLWYFNPVSLKWTVANGNGTRNVNAVYGTQGVAAAANTPGARGGALGWRSKTGNLYLFGGFISDAAINGDMWMFTIDPTCGDIGTPPTINIGNDTTYCSTFSRVLSTGTSTTVWSNGDTASQITITQPGTYWAAINTTCGSASDTIKITQSIIAVQPAAVSTTCGQDNGLVAVTPTSGTAPYTYYWSNTYSSDTVSNLAPGTYTVTVTDHAGCSATTSAVVSAGNNGLTLQAVSGSTSCGLNNGAVSVSATTGTAPYTYDWNTGATTDSLSNLSPGTYMVTVTDHLGCSATTSAVVNSGGSNLALQLDTVNSTCGQSNGDISISVVSGTAPYTYNWSNGSTSSSLFNITQGTFTVTVTDHLGCTGTATAAISSNGSVPTLLTVPVGTTCGLSNGSVSVTVVSGTAPYSYSWSTGGTTDTLLNISAGTYYVTVSDDFGCSGTASAVVSSSSSNLGLQTQPVSTSCGQTNGVISVAVSTGNPPYAYDWSTGGTTDTLTGLSPGTYYVTVSDNAGCSGTASGTVVSGGNNLALQAGQVNTSCGLINGSVSVAVLSGTSPYNYDWSTGSSSDTLSNLASGTYNVTVTDHVGCSGTASATVASSSPATPATATANNNNLCPGDSTTVCAPSGYASYQWNTGNSTQCITTTLAGNYYLTVTDDQGCTANSNQVVINVLSPPPVNISISGDTLTAYNAITYQWYYNGTAIPGDTGSTIVATKPGSYSVAVSDTSGCIILSNDVNVTTGIAGLASAITLKVYPDPATDELYISYQLNAATNLQICITDIIGQRITTILNEKELNGSYLQHINIRNLASAVYILNFTTESGSVNLKFVKE